MYHNTLLPAAAKAGFCEYQGRKVFGAKCRAVGQLRWTAQEQTFQAPSWQWMSLPASLGLLALPVTSPMQKQDCACRVYTCIFTGDANVHIVHCHNTVRHAVRVRVFVICACFLCLQAYGVQIVAHRLYRFAANALPRKGQQQCPDQSLSFPLLHSIITFQSCTASQQSTLSVCCAGPGRTMPCHNSSICFGYAHHHDCHYLPLGLLKSVVVG